MRRILITGSRDWPRERIVEAVLDSELHDDHLTIVHGGARGADSMAAHWARRMHRNVTVFFRGEGMTLDVVEEKHPVNWSPYGIYNPMAGRVRNQEMVDAGADVCYAFIYRGSPGATHCAERAAAAGIPVVRIEIA
jgi:hypothetical protein